ncbi:MULTISPECIES: PQQ-binding-like beta-propeller repeat protein [unclassified Sphingobium]|uniref:outer membrane protein assembly factor BamB family protein n=1 Tax=unclassified Sphingobium TaxID=2611147 RepID=UPI00222582FD|nr:MULTISPECIES: PQQ-binding-like beta-propeller repeat protein [unclassified Sphingobium]MCW2381518.1 outer membrane protein assembly factor BamB [Sphingobium sp. B2D3B]MCW2398375.1 outer membrane protein assembly factor BamB [Sphingobium sp. B2D3C]
MRNPTSYRAAWIGIPAALLLLTGCGGKSGPKTPVHGDRTSILGSNNVLAVDDAVASLPVTLPPPVVNAAWAQSGGNAAKAIGHVALGDTIQQAWSASVTGGGSRSRLAAAPVVADGKLFVIDTDATVSAFDAKTGARLWSKSIRSPNQPSQVQFGGGVSVEGDRLFATSGAGSVAALNVADGAEIWKVQPGGPLRGAPTLSNGNAYVMSQDNQLFALSQADGAVVWTDSGTLEATGVFGVGAPAAAQGSVIAGYSSGELTAYRYENGRALWGDALSRTSISTSVAMLTDIDADPVVDRGQVFAIGEGGRMAAYELVSGQRLWELNIGGIATPLVVSDWVFVVTDKSKLLAITRATGKIRWISDLPAWRKPKKKTGPIRWRGPILAGGKLILVSTEGAMAFVDPTSGKVLQERDLKQGLTLPPIVADNMLYVLTDEGRILAFR